MLLLKSGFEYSTLFRNDVHNHVTSLYLRSLIDLSVLSNTFSKLLHYSVALLLISHLAASKSDVNLYSITFVKELAYCLLLHIDIVNIRSKLYSNFLSLSFLLLLLCFLVSLALLEKKLSVIHYSTHWILRIRRNAD